MFCICEGLCSECPNPIPDHDCTRGVYCGSMFMWLSEQLAVIAKTWKFSEMMVLQLLGGHDPDMFCSNLIKGLKPVLSEFPQAFGFFQRHILSVTTKCCPSICPWVKQYFSICQQEKKGKNWHKQQDKYKDATFKDTFWIPVFSLALL